ncbi:MAG: hypothetical protein CME62_14295 [Halobacteriovoraceae bacterium]|nr:hypothetical protein [Halobacteriovoraceae bacterium]
MKKLLVAVMALTMVNAFADGEHMVKMNGCFDGGRCDNLDFYMYSDTDENGNDAEKTDTQTIALNYAYGWDMWGVGISYKTMEEKTDGEIADVGDKYNTIGLSFYWNKDGSWSDSCFAALHYDMTSIDDEDDTDDSGLKRSDITLEYGHRYALGKAMMGVQINYVPSVTYMMRTDEYNNDDADNDSATELRLNFANFAAVF